MSLALSSTALRFAAVGVVNTLIDIGLFVLLHERLGIVLANFVSTCAGMTFSFVVNGLFTFGARRLTLRHALLFLATTGLTMWVVQPIVILLVFQLIDVAWFAKLTGVAACFVVNFVSYRLVVWPITDRPRVEKQAASESAQRA